MAFFFFFLYALPSRILFVTRSVGGMRVSLYNAITEEETDKIVAYMRQFLRGTPLSGEQTH